MGWLETAVLDSKSGGQATAVRRGRFWRGRESGWGTAVGQSKSGGWETATSTSLSAGCFPL